MIEQQAIEPIVDVRPLAKPDKHPTIFAAYRELPVGGSLVLVNDHDPMHLRDEFEIDHPGSHRWEYLAEQPRDWRIRITKLTSTPLPRVLINTGAAVRAAARDATGAIWKLQMRDRDLDSNVVALPAGGSVDAHAGPEIDVLLHVLSGSGRLVTEIGEIPLETGALIWLPRRSRRRIAAGSEGLRYLTVHQRRQALTLTPGARRAGR
jgi:uncharacterized protein (DUF2249 family)